MVDLNWLLSIFLFLYLARVACQIYLNQLHTSYLRKHATEVPEAFRDFIDREKLGKISSYTLESANFGLRESLLSQAFFLAILLSGFLPWLFTLISQWKFSLTISGLIFWGVLGIISTLWQVPFNFYENFIIEAKYGFNTKTIRLWISDFCKSLLLSFILGGMFLYLLLSLIKYGGNFWWFWAWIILGLVELLIIFLYPVLIAPGLINSPPSQMKI